MRFNSHILDDIRHRIDIIEFISSFGVTVKRAGSSYKACCPFHKEKTPSFHINPHGQFYHCFGCGEHGDIFKFLMKQSGLSFSDAVTQLAEKSGVKLDKGYDPNAAARDTLLALHADLAAFYQRCLLQSKEAQPARHYLESRNLGPDIIKRFTLGYAPTAPNALLRWADKHKYALQNLVDAGLLALNKSDTPYDRFAGRLTFPIHDTQGRVIAFSCRILDPASHPAKYVNSPETIIFKKSKILYGLHLARAAITKHPHREAILCEGQIDVIRCHAAGFDTAVASQGTAFTDEHIDILKRYADSILIAYDADPAGQKAALKAGSLLFGAGLPVRVLSLPPGEDPDSLIRRDGPPAFQSAIAHAASLITFQIRSLQQAETDPNSLDAISRITRAVIATLAACPSAILRAHLLAEAADQLRLPPAALDEDLQKFRADAEKRAALQASFAQNNPTNSSALSPQPSALSPQPSALSPQPLALPADPQSPIIIHHSSFINPLPPSPPPHSPISNQQSAISNSPPPSLPSRTQTDLCKLLLHHAGDDKHLATLIQSWLPPILPLHPFTQRILQAALDDLADRLTIHIPSLANDPDPLFQNFHAMLAAAESRITHSEELKPLDEARDLIAKIWSRELLQSRRDLLPPGDPKRLLLTRTINHLQRASWEIRQNLIRPFLPGGDETIEFPVSQPAPVAEPPPLPPPETNPRGSATPLPHEEPASDDLHEIF